MKTNNTNIYEVFYVIKDKNTNEYYGMYFDSGDGPACPCTEYPEWYSDVSMNTSDEYVKRYQTFYDASIALKCVRKYYKERNLIIVEIEHRCIESFKEIKE